MLQSLTGNSFLVLAVLVFVTVLLLLEGLYVVWRERRGPQAVKLRNRLKSVAAPRERAPQSGLLKQRLVSELPALERFLQGLPRVQRLERFVLQSGVSVSVLRLLASCAGCAVLGWGAAVFVLRAQPLLALGAAAAAAAMPFAYVGWHRRRRLAKIGRQLPDALDLLTRSLRAGHAFASAVKMAGEELPEPIAGEFAAVHEEVNFGVSMQQALTHLCERVPSTDVRYFAVAVLIQRESGGNLTEILGNLSHLMRERLKLLAKVRVLSSEARMSGWVLVALPFFLAGLINLVNPKFMSPLWTDPIGISIVKYMLTLMAVGVVIMRRIVQIRI